MPIITLENDVVVQLHKIYARFNHPFGKNRRGRKKWTKLFAIRSLTKQARKFLAHTEEDWRYESTVDEEC